MARLKVFEVVPGSSPSAIWADVRHYLSLANSVEVVTTPGGGFELHVWVGVRSDGSNVSGASHTPGALIHESEIA